jgi:hypothetical protein
MNVQTKNHSFEELMKWPDRHVRNKLATLYETAKQYHRPSIVELGTYLLQVWEANDGQLVSVDISDCSDISDNRGFIFCNPTAQLTWGANAACATSM